MISHKIEILKMFTQQIALLFENKKETYFEENWGRRLLKHISSRPLPMHNILILIETC